MNMKRIIICLCLSVLANLLVHSSAYALISKEGGFSVAMPGKAKMNQVNHKSIVGDVKENTYSIKTKTDEYSASYTMLPDIALSMQSDKSLLTQAKEGFVKDSGALEISFEKIDIQGKEGRELKYTVAGQDGKESAGIARFVISNKLLYVIAANGANQKSVNRFINSFKLLQ